MVTLPTNFTHDLAHSKQPGQGSENLGFMVYSAHGHFTWDTMIADTMVCTINNNIPRKYQVAAGGHRGGYCDHIKEISWIHVIRRCLPLTQ